MFPDVIYNNCVNVQNILLNIAFELGCFLYTISDTLDTILNYCDHIRSVAHAHCVSNLQKRHYLANSTMIQI